MFNQNKDSSQNQTESTDKVKSLLSDISKRKKVKKETAIYGVYDNRNASISTRINDFLIDHTRIPLKEKAYFFHLMAVMIDAGIPVLQTLKILANKTRNLHFQRILNTLSYSTARGTSLSDAMARFPDVFNDADLGVIKAGESVGNLNQMLFRLSEQTEKSHNLQTKLITAATYPVIVFVVLIGISTAMMIWIVPTLINLLKEGGLSEDQFPFATKILIAVSGFIEGYWWLIGILAVIIYSLYKVYRETEVGKFQSDYFKLRIPVVGTLTRKVLVLRFVSLLGILIEAGLPVLSTLQIIASSIDSAPYRAKIWEVIKKVQAGEKISTNLEDSPFLFPETITEMIGIGERSASIGSISQKIAEHYDREIDNSLKRLTSLFEPLMILFVGLIVALLALAILMPIFDLTKLV